MSGDDHTVFLSDSSEHQPPDYTGSGLCETAAHTACGEMCDGNKQKYSNHEKLLRQLKNNYIHPGARELLCYGEKTRLCNFSSKRFSNTELDTEPDRHKLKTK